MATPAKRNRVRTQVPASATDLAWSLDDELIPRPGLPAADRIAKRQRRLRRYVRFTAVSTPIFLVVAIFVALSGVHAAPTSSNSSRLVASSLGRSAATLEIENWLAQNPSPLPGAVVASWDGARDIAPAPQSGTNQQMTWTAELDTFTLSVGNLPSPTLYRAGVEVALKPSGGAVALGGPSLELIPPTDVSSGWDQGGPWSGIASLSGVSTSVQGAIDGWLSAYTSGSESRLRLAVGDTLNDGVYPALTGVKTATDTVVASALRAAPNSAPKLNATPSAEIVEVNLTIIWQDERVPPGYAQTGSGSGPSTTMDLLVERADTAAPVVVAWGPPGTGPSLLPYQNVVRP